MSRVLSNPQSPLSLFASFVSGQAVVVQKAAPKEGSGGGGSWKGGSTRGVAEVASPRSDRLFIKEIPAGVEKQDITDHFSKVNGSLRHSVICDFTDHAAWCVF